MQKQTIGSEQTLQSPFVTQFRFNRKNYLSMSGSNSDFTPIAHTQHHCLI